MTAVAAAAPAPNASSQEAMIAPGLARYPHSDAITSVQGAKAPQSRRTPHAGALRSAPVMALQELHCPTAGRASKIRPWHEHRRAFGKYVGAPADAAASTGSQGPSAPAQIVPTCQILKASSGAAAGRLHAEHSQLQNTEPQPQASAAAEPAGVGCRSQEVCGRPQQERPRRQSRLRECLPHSRHLLHCACCHALTAWSHPHKHSGMAHDAVLSVAEHGLCRCALT